MTVQCDYGTVECELRAVAFDLGTSCANGTVYFDYGTADYE